MHDRRFVEDLITAVPEAFAEPGDRDDQLTEPLPYITLAQARIWIEDQAADRVKRRTVEATLARTSSRSLLP